MLRRMSQAEETVARLSCSLKEEQAGVSHATLEPQSHGVQLVRLFPTAGRIRLNAISSKLQILLNDHASIIESFTPKFCCKHNEKL